MTVPYYEFVMTSCTLSMERILFESTDEKFTLVQYTYTNIHYTQLAWQIQKLLHIKESKLFADKCMYIKSSVLMNNMGVVKHFRVCILTTIIT